MLPMDKFKTFMDCNIREENSEQEPLIPLMVVAGEEAKMYISRIYDEGAEQVLDEILRDDPDTRAPSIKPDDTLYNEIQVSDKVIMWSKSGIEPFVGVYQIGHDGGEVIQQTDYGDEEMQEDKIKNVDRRAVEDASHFILRGFDENVIGRVVDDACNKCFETEEALAMVRNLVKEDPRLASYALDEEEEEIFGEYRHALRKKFLGQNNDVVHPQMYEVDVGGGLLGDPRTSAEIPPQMVDPQTQTEIANLQAEIADKEADHAKEMERLKSQLMKLQKDQGLNEKTDPNKGSQIAGFRHEGGPQALANSISQMSWDGPGSQFDVFLNEITVDGYNMLGSAASGKTPEQPEQQPDPTQDIDSGVPQEPQVTPEPDTGDDVDLAAL